MRFLVLVCLLLAGCGGEVKAKGIQLGIDPNWYPLDFGPQVSYINGFVEEVLLDVAMSAKTDYIRQSSSPDSLLSDLQSGRFDAVLTSLPPYNFNLAKYDFSQNFLELGPVLIIPLDSSHTELKQMNGRLVGIVANDQTVLVLQKYQEIIVRSYPSIPELLNAVTTGEIEGALLYRIPASNYIRDLYSGQLKITGKPLTNEGLHLVALKGHKPQTVKPFDRALETLKKKRMEELLKKWQLD